ncbi:MAG: hypothetical protein EBZ74_09370 [Planctomycetia bacterium]|nr:hypothetical protein [Planctomycetia bacterium]
MAALAAAAVRWLLPLVRYRVNLVYAARAIEREHPELHNDLVNTVLAKAHPGSNPEKVVRSLERRTAKRLAQVPTEAVIDRTVPLRLAYALAGLVVLAGLYELAAPKSLLVSAARLLAPWAGWAAPSRVRIEPPRLAWRMPAEQGAADDALERRRLVVDGDTATLVRGRQLVVAADIRGLRGGEKPHVGVVSLRADGGVDPALPVWEAEMARSPVAGAGERLFVAVLPDARRGLDQSLEITIAAGDARSRPVRVLVVDSPTLLVREVRYAFPAYTRRAPEAVAWQGDIRAVEGTEVTVVAEANRPIDEAWIDFDADGGRDLRFTKSAADLARVTKSFHLGLKADASGPEHSSYRLVFQPRSAEGSAREAVVVDPLEHRIEVVADVAPEVVIEEPRESPLRVPPAAPVTVRVQAHDPDFALARVAIETRLEGGAAGPEIVLLKDEHAGLYRGVAELVPERLGAGAGATLEYRAVAVDNRPKRPNVSHSPWQALRIDPAAPPRRPAPPPGRRPSDERRAPGGEPGNGGSDGAAADAADARDRRPDATPQDDERPRKDADGGRADRERQEQRSDESAHPGRKDGQAGGPQGGEREQQPADAKQRGDRQGQGENQGQGAESGQGVGARGERQGGRDEASAGQAQGQTGQRHDPGGGRLPGPGRGRDGQEGERQGEARRNSVAADGTNDGEALERILEHRREQGSKPGGANEDRAAGPRQPGERRDGSGEAGEAGEARDAGETGSRPDASAPDAQGSAGAPGSKPTGGGGEKAGSSSPTAGVGQSSGTDAGTAGKAGQKPGPGQDGAADGPGKESEERGASQQRGASEQAPEGGQAAGGKEGMVGKRSGGGAQNAGGEQRADGTPAADGAQARPGRQGAGAPQPGGSAAPAAGEPGSGAGETGSGGWAGGDATRRDAAARAAEGPLPAREMEWGEQDVAHARNAAGLAVEHLRDSVEAGRTDVLDRLGWTREQARAFLDRWERMRRLAESDDPASRGEFERSLRSLGLRPDGVRSSRDVPADTRGGQAEGRRSRPPRDYWEQFKAYTQGTAGE